MVGTDSRERRVSIYSHVPWCRSRCSYCDFNTYTGIDNLIAPYLHALIREIALLGAAAPTGVVVPTIFFGGGTPSLLSLPQLAEIVDALRRSFALAPDCEITLEANPGTVNAEYLAGLAALGVNRLSFGVQSAQPGELALLERQHSFAEAAQAVAWAQAAGFANGVNVDLIYGLPYQSLSAWQDTLEQALALQPDHISLYCLTLEAGTRLHDQVARGVVATPDADLAADMYLHAEERLAGAYEHYEISNWCRPGRACRHNLVYWRNEPYLGLGAGAHGSYGGWRYSNVLRPRRYIGRLGSGERGAGSRHRAAGSGNVETHAMRPGQETGGRRQEEIEAPRGRPGGSSVGAGPDTSPPIPLSWRDAPGEGERGGEDFPFSPALAEREAIGSAMAMGETMMLGLRLLDEGVRFADFQARHGVDLRVVYPHELEEAGRRGLIELLSDRVRLSVQGRLLGNKAFALFLPG